MNDIQKIQLYFDHLESSWSCHPDLIQSREAYEAWEQAYHPSPVCGKGRTVTIGQLRLTLKNKAAPYLIYLTWCFSANCPLLVVETAEVHYQYPVAIAKGNITLAKPELVHVKSQTFHASDVIEMVYDVIDYLIKNKPHRDISQVNKKQFVDTLAELNGTDAENQLKLVARLSARKLKSLIRQATSDMASDDLSAQLTLPLSGSYALGAVREETESPPNEPYAVIDPKTMWQITQELHLLSTVTRLNYETAKALQVPLKDAVIMDQTDPGRTIIRLPGINDLMLTEGQPLHIHQTDPPQRLGSAVIGLIDEDVLYGTLFWDEAVTVKSLEQVYLKPVITPQRLLLTKIRALLDLLTQNPHDLKGALRYVLGVDPAHIHHDSASAIDCDADYSQEKALRAACHPENKIVAVQGPPGTGKTWLLTQLIRYFCRMKLRIIITAPSNTAVDNICKSITDLPVLRFGQKEKVDPLVQGTCWYGDPDNISTFLKQYQPGKTGMIYAATHVKTLTEEVIATDLHKKGLFDVIVFDEAGMSRMDEFLLCAQLGQRVIVVGDQQQLPPFPLETRVLQELQHLHPCLSSRTRQIITLSALEWLAESRAVPIIMLERSYRCQNPRLLRFASALFYNAQVKTSANAEYLRLPYHMRQTKYPSATLRFYNTGTLNMAQRQDKIVCDQTKMGIENPGEAYICRYVVLNALDRYPLDQITVISPYRRQIRRIKSMLSLDQVKSLLPSTISPEQWQAFLDARIATVDSFQGGESDLVVISYVRSNDNQGIGFVDNPNRINVAHTRCRRELVIIGDLICLKKQAKSNIFAKMERAFARDGEIIDVTGDSFEAMKFL